jgi:hypothetical protein
MLGSPLFFLSLGMHIIRSSIFVVVLALVLVRGGRGAGAQKYLLVDVIRQQPN